MSNPRPDNTFPVVAAADYAKFHALRHAGLFRVHVIHLSSKQHGANALYTNRVRPLPRSLVYLWALPTTSIGLLFIPLTLLSGGKIQRVDGVIELYGGVVTFFLTHCTVLRGGASAMTFGHVVLGRDRFLLDATRNHERVHVRQCERWGPFFIPAYLVASLIALLKGQRPYMDNAFEREAYGHAL